MQLPEISIRRPVFATVLSLLVVLVGLVSFKGLSVREYPRIDEPTVTVTTRFAGASSEVIESQVTKVLEDSLAGIEGVDIITSISRQEQSQITVRFKLERDPDSAAADVRDKVSRVRQRLPQDVDEPTIAKVEADATPVIWIAMNSETRSALELSDLANRVAKPLLQTAPGAAEVRIFGERRFSMRLWLDPDRLAAYGLTVQDAEDALRRSNLEVPAGRIESSQREFNVTAATDLQTPEQFRAIVIRNINGQAIRIGDVARVVQGPQDERTAIRLNGRDAISLGVIRQATANPLELSAAVRAMLPRLEADLPKDIRFDIANDNSVFIDRSIKAVYQTIAEAVVLVALVIFVFLRTLRASIIPLVTIPVSLIGAFALMALFGFSINTLTLLALVLAIGLVVDDAIVMLENIYRHIEEGMKPFDAAIKGAREIGFAIVAMTLTLAAVYAPLAFTPGRTGRLFAEFALALAGAVVVSGFVALTLSPMMCSKLLKHVDQPGRFDRFMERVLNGINRGYERVLSLSLNVRWLVVAVMAASAAGSWWMLQHIRSELAPLEDRGVILVSVNGPDGATLAYTRRYAEAIERIGGQYPEFDRIFSNTGNPSVAQGSVFLRAKPWEERTRSTLQIAREIAPKLAQLPGVSAFAITPPSLGQGFRERPINYVIITGDSYENLAGVVRKFQERLAQNPGFVQVDTDLRLNKPEIRLDVDRERAADMGVSVDAIARTVETMLGGRTVTRYKRDGEQYDVVVQTVSANRSTPEDIDRLWRRDDPAGLAGEDPRGGGAARTQPLRPAPQRLAHRQPGGQLLAGRGPAVPRRGRARIAATRLHHRPQRPEPRVPQRLGLAGAGVRALAAVHLPGAVGAVRELRRPVHHHAVGAAVDVRCAAGPAAVGRHAQRVQPDRAHHAGGPHHQARHPDRGVRQPVARAGPGQAVGGEAVGRAAAAAHPHDHRRHGAGRDPAGHRHRRGR